jgi:hypothetical protein
MAELKHIDFSSNVLPANGVNYKIMWTLAAKRWQEFEKLQIYFGFGLTFLKMVKWLQDARHLANSGKAIEAWNMIVNLEEGIVYGFEDRIHPTLLLCSLFIVTEDEDLSTWREEDQKVKIDNWNKELYDVNDFFLLASSLVKDFVPTYNEISQNISQKIPTGKSKGSSKRPSK